MVENININNMNLEIIGLYRSNYLGQFHIRQMARLIEKSHVGLLPHLKKLEKDKILVFREIGKSKVYSLNLKNNQVMEFLSFSEKKKALEILSEEPFIKKIYDEFISLDSAGCLVLFGSYASKTNLRESDIDLLYIGEFKEDDEKEIKNLGKAYNKEIHLVSMGSRQFREQLLKQGALVKEIIINHIVLYNQDLFISEVWRYYNEKNQGF